MVKLRIRILTYITIAAAYLEPIFDRRSKQPRIRSFENEFDWVLVRTSGWGSYAPPMASPFLSGRKLSLLPGAYPVPGRPRVKHKSTLPEHIFKNIADESCMTARARFFLSLLAVCIRF